jgi:hypothetical protein
MLLKHHIQYHLYHVLSTIYSTRYFIYVVFLSSHLPYMSFTQHINPCIHDRCLKILFELNWEVHLRNNILEYEDISELEIVNDNVIIKVPIIINIRLYGCGAVFNPFVNVLSSYILWSRKHATICSILLMRKGDLKRFSLCLMPWLASDGASQNSSRWIPTTKKSLFILLS